MPVIPRTAAHRTGAARAARGPFVSRAPGFALAAALLCASPAFAGDGAIEIDQARALAGGVTPGDVAGFPVTLTRSGSYRLTGNLTVSDPAAHAILVNVDGVTLDLAGFQIQGPVLCTGSGATLSCGAGSGAGIQAPALARISVRDGRVGGFGTTGVNLGPEARVEGVDAESNGLNGIRVADRSAVTESTAYGNANDGIQTGSGTVVSHCVAAANRFAGIFAGSGSTVIGNATSQNGEEGIAGFSGSVLRANGVHANAKAGLAVASGVLVTSNAVHGNGGAGVEAGAGATIQRNAVRGNGAGLVLLSDASWRENTISGNGGVPASGGIDLLDNSCDGATTCP